MLYAYTFEQNLIFLREKFNSSYLIGVIKCANVAFCSILIPLNEAYFKILFFNHFLEDTIFNLINLKCSKF